MNDRQLTEAKFILSVLALGSISVALFVGKIDQNVFLQGVLGITLAFVTSTVIQVKGASNGQ